VPETEKITIMLPGYFPPSLNVTSGQHWAKTRKHKKLAEKHLLVACLRKFGRVPVFEGKVTLQVFRYIAGRRQMMDPDNLGGSQKPLIDAMRKPKSHRNSKGRQGGLGIIEDDDPSLLELLEPEQHKVTKDELKGESIACIIEITGRRVDA